VHGGGGQGTDYMGIDGNASWAHYYVQAGYQTYIIDRPGHGRSPFHPDALGPMGALPTYRTELSDGARGKPRQWNGTGLPGDPLLDQFMASQNATMQDGALAQRLWRSRGAELLDKIGPAIIQTHSAGGPFGWLTADARPNLVKAIVCYEGAPGPLLAQGNGPAQPLPNLKGIPVLYFEAENSGRTVGARIREPLVAAGADPTVLNLRERGITGNSHFSMLENNRKQVFEFIRGWVESKVPPASRQTA
jgi:pimeloyl-ACP methyl ester carboxylesterase